MKKIAYAPSAKKARVLNSTTIYEGPVFGIRRDEVIEPSGLRGGTTRSSRRKNPAHPAVPPRYSAVFVGVSGRADGPRRNAESSRGARADRGNGLSRKAPASFPGRFSDTGFPGRTDVPTARGWADRGRGGTRRGRENSLPRL